jgi:hypothetical protein
MVKKLRKAEGPSLAGSGICTNIKDVNSCKTNESCTWKKKSEKRRAHCSLKPTRFQINPKPETTQKQLKQLKQKVSETIDSFNPYPFGQFDDDLDDIVAEADAEDLINYIVDNDDLDNIVDEFDVEEFLYRPSSKESIQLRRPSKSSASPRSSATRSPATRSPGTSSTTRSPGTSSTPRSTPGTSSTPKSSATRYGSVLSISPLSSRSSLSIPLEDYESLKTSRSGSRLSESGSGSGSELGSGSGLGSRRSDDEDDVKDLDQVIEAALKAGQINESNQGKNGSVAWKEFVNKYMLTDDIIGTWILNDISDIQHALVVLADQISQDSPLWMKMHFLTQPYRIRLNSPASLRRIAQIAFNWTSAGLPLKNFNYSDFISI